MPFFPWISPDKCTLLSRDYSLRSMHSACPVTQKKISTSGWLNIDEYGVNSETSSPLLFLALSNLQSLQYLESQCQPKSEEIEFQKALQWSLALSIPTTYQTHINLDAYVTHYDEIKWEQTDQIHVYCFYLQPSQTVINIS